MAVGAERRFRADQVGSLMRPDHLLRARSERAANRISSVKLRELEDECIRDVVRRQEDIGMPVVTDGEYRRYMFHIDFLEKVGGIETRPGTFKHPFKGGHSHDDDYRPMVFEVTGKLKHERNIAVDDFRFLQRATSRTGKVTIPSPTFAYARGGRTAISKSAYPDLEEFYEDLGAVYRAEIAALGEAGCTYVQLDETNIVFLCDPDLVAGVRERGEEPEVLAAKYLRTINDAVAGRPENMSVCIHLCRGNYRGAWVAEGGYDPIAEQLFSELNVDGFLLEYDDERSGDFAPLRFVPKGKSVTLGLVTTKNGALESPNSIKRRIEDASRYIPLDQLGISPQCGFSSGAVEGGNVMTPAEQWKKLELVVKVAQEMWGGAAH